jgi:hypothetical protein
LRFARPLQPRLDKPLPLWMIFPVIFAALYASHFTLLRLPYYWDEAGYYIPAAWDFYRTGTLIPVTTLTNAHPPLPAIYLALWWKASGFLPEVTREAVLMVATLGLLAVWRLAMRVQGSPAVASWTVALTAMYPVWFAQSSLAHGDIFAAACTLWGLVYSLPERDHKPWAAALWFACAALSKETAIAIPITLAAISLGAGLRVQPAKRGRLLSEAAWLAGSALPLIAWYAYHYAKTGYVFGNPEYVHYNAEATLDPVRILAAFVHRVLHLTAHMNLFVPVIMTFAALLLKPRMDADGLDRIGVSRPVWHKILVLLLVNALEFSVLGGALLTRYLLPMYPLVLLMAVATFYRRVPFWHGLALFSAGAFVVGLFVNPPYRFAPEDNLAYARVIRLHEAGIDQLNRHFRGATVLSAWPVTDELTRPELGYVKQPYDVYRLDDFTPTQIARAAGEPEKYSAGLVFSTKYDPPTIGLSLGPGSEALDERYFGLHHDLQPEAIAAALHASVVWKTEDQGQWIALLGFPRQFEARLNNPAQPARSRDQAAR